MMDGNDGVLLTARDVQAWTDRKADLERAIAEAQRELAEINRNLEAAAVLQDRKAAGGTPAGEPPAADSDEDDGFGSPVAG